MCYVFIYFCRVFLKSYIFYITFFISLKEFPRDIRAFIFKLDFKINDNEF